MNFPGFFLYYPPTPVAKLADKHHNQNNKNHQAPMHGFIHRSLVLIIFEKNESHQSIKLCS